MWTDGTVCFKWSHRESHPDLQRAVLASSCWTMTPCQAEAVGLEPTSGMSAAACFPSRFLTSSDDFRYRFHQGGSRETRTHKRLFAATCFQDRAPHPAGWLPSFKLRRLESNQHEDVQSVSSYR